MGNCNISLSVLAKIVSIVINNSNHQHSSLSTSPWQLQCQEPNDHSQHKPALQPNSTDNQGPNPSISLPQGHLNLFHPQPLQMNANVQNFEHPGPQFSHDNPPPIDIKLDNAKAAEKIKTSLNTILTSISIPVEDVRDSTWLAHQWQEVHDNIKESSLFSKHFGHKQNR
jgi:hypothetical protein